MTGTVNSGLDPTPVELASSAANVELAIEQTKTTDVFFLGVPVKVLGLTFTILAEIYAPYNSITKLSPYPFSGRSRSPPPPPRWSTRTPPPAAAPPSPPR
jgi:hypothetical protein